MDISFIELLSDFDWYVWVGLPLLIFLARVFDVTLGTLRIIFTSRGLRNLAPVLGFIETFVWIVAVSSLVKHAQNLAAYVGYAGGFALGTLVGMFLENKLAIGTVTIRAIIRRDPRELIQALLEAGFGITTVDGKGSTGNVKIIYTTLKRQDLPVVIDIFHRALPGAFLSVEEVRSTEQGVFPAQKNQFARKLSVKK
ncbi:MAG: DUF2179 domain-containing protein [Anaerolineales bacterium]|nr:DUF2179 domain-containing protein [Anaerolineales bacterium]